MSEINATPSMTPRTIKFWACGGTGTNLVNRFNKSRNKEVAGFATLQSCFIDTSTSNMDPAIPASDIFLFEECAGSGKRQEANYGVIFERRLEIINKFKPADLNIFVHSTSGGTGPTAAQVLCNELLKQGFQCISICVGNTSSYIETQNTLATLQRYEKMIAARARPLAMYYRENSPTNPRGEVDRDVHAALVMISILFSGQNRELDVEDLNNFLDYQAVTRHRPMLVGLEIFSGDVLPRQGEMVFSLATLTDEETSAEPNVLCDYQTTGFLPSVLRENVGSRLPMHFATLGGYFTGVVKSLEDKMKAHNDTVTATPVKNVLAAKPMADGADFIDF